MHYAKSAMFSYDGMFDDKGLYGAVIDEDKVHSYEKHVFLASKVFLPETLGPNPLHNSFTLGADVGLIGSALRKQVTLEVGFGFQECGSSSH